MVIAMDSYNPSQEEQSFDIPPLVNQPPQVFGSYAPGSPLGGSYQGNFFPDDQVGENIEESNDAKRRRIARVRMLDMHDSPSIC